MLTSLKREILRDGLFFHRDDDSREADKDNDDANELSRLRAYDGFRCEILSRELISCNTKDDARALVSLALVDPRSSSQIAMYGDKVAVMCINVNRLRFTHAAFRLDSRVCDPLSEAFDFYLRVDSSHAHSEEPNVRFSNLLHMLRRDCYESYLFELARRLGLSVDLIRCRRHTRRDNIENTFYRYRNACDRGIGVLTAVRHVDRWYVVASEKPVVTPRRDSSV